MSTSKFTLFEQLVLRSLLAILSCLQIMMKAQFSGLVPGFVAESTKEIANLIATFLLQDDQK
jgi:hypothetical protein